MQASRALAAKMAVMFFSCFKRIIDNAGAKKSLSQSRLFVWPGGEFARQQGVHGGHDEHGQQRAQAHAADDDPADLLAALRPGTASRASSV